MIIGQFEQLKKHLSKHEIVLINTFVKNVFKGQIQINNWVFLDGENLKAIVLDKSNFKEGVFESHFNNIDIHLVLRGEDNIYLGEISNSKETGQYNQVYDYTLYNGKPVLKVVLGVNTFAFILPGELHSTQFNNSNNLKVVVKKLVK